MRKMILVMSFGLASVGVVHAYNKSNDNRYNEVGRYQISANGDYIIDTKTGIVKTNAVGGMNKAFYEHN